MDLSSATDSLVPDPASQYRTSHSDLTLEPFDDFRKFNAKKQIWKEKRIKKLLTLEETFATEKQFPKYHVINFPGINIYTQLNVLAADKNIKEKIGKPKKMTKMNKNSILVEVYKEEQMNKLHTLKTIAGHPVTIEKHRTMNFVKGTILSETMSQSSLEELRENLSDQGVVNIERMKRKINGELCNTHRYIITFAGTRLPRVVTLADWHHEIVDLYIPTPMRCMRCQKLGHTKKWCRQESDVCAQCCKEGHIANDCGNEPFCVNCKGDHHPRTRSCSAYEFQCEILATQAREHITRLEATEKVKERFVQEGRTFSTVVVEGERARPSRNVQNTYEVRPPIISLSNRYENIENISENQSNFQQREKTPQKNSQNTPGHTRQKLATPSQNKLKHITSIPDTPSSSQAPGVFESPNLSNKDSKSKNKSSSSRTEDAKYPQEKVRSDTENVSHTKPRKNLKARNEVPNRKVVADYHSSDEYMDESSDRRKRVRSNSLTSFSDNFTPPKNPTKSSKTESQKPKVNTTSSTQSERMRTPHKEKQKTHFQIPVLESSRTLQPK